MTKYLPFCYDKKQFFTNQKCFFITTNTPAYLTAFFNSSLFKFCFRDSFPELQGGTRELSKIFFDKIPVRIVDKKTEQEFDEIITILQRHFKKELAQEIDKKIFELYELTNDEQRVIGFIEIK